MNKNTIVAEIHESFSTAEEELLNRAKQILSQAGDEDNKQRAEQLARMGFGSAKPVRMLSKEEQDKAEKLLFLKQRYNRIAPQYKFITEEKLLSICKKYGIVVGSSERYTEDIPLRNQEDITNFKIIDESFLEISDDTYRNAEHKTRDGEKMHPKDMATSHIENTLTFIRRQLSKDEQAGMYMSRSDVGGIDVDLIRAMITELVLRGETATVEQHKKMWKDRSPFGSNKVEKLFTPIKTTYFYVAANIDSFNTEGVKLENNVLVEENNNKQLEESMKEDLFREYDPIVLAKVQGGYLIVTAWGDEASDPDVINPGRN